MYKCMLNIKDETSNIKLIAIKRSDSIKKKTLLLVLAFLFEAAVVH